MFQNIFIDLAQYYKASLIEKGNSSQIYLVEDKNTKKSRVAKIFDFDLEEVVKNSPININYNINAIFNIKYPSIIKFIGLSQKNFENKQNTVIITKYMPKKSLIHVIKSSKSDDLTNHWNDTTKLINIFGIASAMSYLHKKNIILGCLTPQKILENKFFYPKIFTFLLNRFNIKPNVYLSPEILEKKEFTAASDVYSFAMIVFLIMTNHEPFEDEIQQITNEEIIYEIINGKRPKFNMYIPQSYYQLIIECWKSDPKKRPTFDWIVCHLKNDPGFITNTINKLEFEQYISLIENKNLEILADEIGLNKINAVKLNNQDFEIKKEIGKGGFGRVYKIKERKNETKKYAAKFVNTINDFKNELEINSILKHPAIIDLVGYLLYTDKDEIHHAIVSEYMTNGSLENALEIERKYSNSSIWTDTQRLIWIFGIASGIAYLHSKKIIYRDIKPENTLLNNFLFPKLIDFGLSLDENIERQRDSNILGTAPFIAPEIFEKGEYSEASDVYAFGVLVYEIMNKEVPFQNLNVGQIMYKVIYRDERPRFNESIPNIFRILIEKCWKKSPKDRPTFNKIVDYLKNHELMTLNADEFLYRSYINYIEGQNVELFNIFNSHSMKLILEKWKSNFHRFPFTLGAYQNQFSNNVHYYAQGISNLNSSAQFLRYDENIKRNFINNYFQSEPNHKLSDKVTIVEHVIEGKYAKIYKIIDIETSKYYTAKLYKDKYNGKTNPLKYHIKEEFEIISSLNHQSMIKYIDYRQIYLDGQFNQMIITEYVQNVSLEKILEMEQSNIKIPYWNDTMRLITIYGIASAMSYLHKRNIIYQDLRPKKVFIDELFLPKIVDFSKSSHIYINYIYNLIQNSVFSAPEIIYKNKYTKSSDVYSFAMLVYEIMAKEYPFGKVDHFKMMHDVVFLKKRPTIPGTVPKAYKDLIIKCWKHNPQKRLTFDQILYELENSKGFITKNVDRSFYFAYIKYLKGHSSEIKNVLIGKTSKFSYQNKKQNETKLYLPSRLSNVKVSLEKFGTFAGPLPHSEPKNNNSENSEVKFQSIVQYCPKQLKIDMTLFIESPYQNKQIQTHQQQLFIPFFNYQPNGSCTLYYYPVFMPEQ